MSVIFKKLKAFNAFRMDQSQTIDSPPFDRLFNSDIDDFVNRLNEEIDYKKAHAADPAASTWSYTGFATAYESLPFFENAVLTEQVALYDDVVPYFLKLENDVVFGVVEIRERIVPGDVLRAAIDKECAALFERTGEPVTRKQRMEIKDVIVARLLATALIKVKPVPVIFLPDEDKDDTVNVLVFNSSRKVCEDVTALFRRVFTSFPVRPLEYDFELPVETLLTHMVNDASSATTYRLQPGTAVKLVGMLGQGEYTLKDEALRDNDHLDDLLNEGYKARRLMIRHFQKGIIDDSAVFSQFTLNYKMAFGGMKLSDVLAQEAATEDSDAWIEFMALTLMYFNELAELLASLERYANWLNDKSTVKTDSTDKFNVLKMSKAFDTTEEDENDQL